MGSFFGRRVWEAGVARIVHHSWVVQGWVRFVCGVLHQTRHWGSMSPAILILPRLHLFLIFSDLWTKCVERRWLPSCLGPITAPVIPFSSFLFCPTKEESTRSSTYSLYFAVLLVLPGLIFSNMENLSLICFFLWLVRKQKLFVQNKRKMIGRYLGKLPPF